MIASDGTKARNPNQYRVALMGIYHESNTFIERKTGIADFENSHLLRGNEIRDEYENSFHEIGGMLEVMDREGIEVLPLLFAEATPGGEVTNEAYSQLLDELISRLVNVLPVDGCLVVPHGAAVSTKYRDLDGHWLEKIREVVGAEVPIVGTLDPHANVSQAMVRASDALIAYKTNPHVDQRETGRAAAELMLGCLHGTVKPIQYLATPAATISIEQQHTAVHPCASLYQQAHAFRSHPQVLSVSVLLGFPYADVPEMGTSFLVVTNEDRQLGEQFAEQLNRWFLAHKEMFVGKKETVEEQLSKIAYAEKPVLWLDMGDNVGGGSLGDSVFLLKAMERDGRFRSFSCIYDPQAVTDANRQQLETRFPLTFGRDYDESGANENYQTKVVLKAKVGGKFRENAPRHGGQVQYDMGETVIVETSAGHTVMIHSLRVPPFSLSQLTTFGIDPLSFDVIIAKGVNAPIAAYGPVCHTILQANTPGVTQADMTKFDFHHRRRPLYPFEDIDVGSDQA